MVMMIRIGEVARTIKNKVSVCESSVLMWKITIFLNTRQ